VRRHGCQRGERFEGCERAARRLAWVPTGFGRGVPPMTKTLRTLFGSGMQQAHTRQEAQTAEVVRNHEGGTGRVGRPGTSGRVEPSAGKGPLFSHVECRAVHADESHGRRMFRHPGHHRGSLRARIRLGGRMRRFTEQLASPVSEHPEVQRSNAKRARGTQQRHTSCYGAGTSPLAVTSSRVRPTP